MSFGTKNMAIYIKRKTATDASRKQLLRLYFCVKTSLIATFQLLNLFHFA